MSLFKKLQTPDRRQTMLAYRVKFWPYRELSETGKELIKWRKHIYMRKGDILLNCNETQEVLYVNERHYRIVWAFNNTPTEQEWNSKSDDYLVRVELRHSPAIPEVSVAVLSFTSSTVNLVHGEEL